jgi:hypothetical protein
MVKHMSD